MKEFSEAKVDDILRIKYGRLVTDGNHTAHATNTTIGKVFGVSGSKIRQLCLERFNKNRRKFLPLNEQMKQRQEQQDR